MTLLGTRGRDHYRPACATKVGTVEWGRTEKDVSLPGGRTTTPGRDPAVRRPPGGGARGFARPDGASQLRPGRAPVPSGRPRYRALRRCRRTDCDRDAGR